MREKDGLSVEFSFVLQPSSLFAAGRVVVGPVDQAPFGIVEILAAERDAFASAKVRQPRRDVDIVDDEYRFAIGKPEDKPLMAMTPLVVGEAFDDIAAIFDPDAAEVLRAGSFYRKRFRGAGDRLTLRFGYMVRPGVECRQQGGQKCPRQIGEFSFHEMDYIAIILV